MIENCRCKKSGDCKKIEKTFIISLILYETRLLNSRPVSRCQIPLRDYKNRDSKLKRATDHVGATSEHQTSLKQFCIQLFMCFRSPNSMSRAQTPTPLRHICRLVSCKFNAYKILRRFLPQICS